VAWRWRRSRVPTCARPGRRSFNPSIILTFRNERSKGSRNVTWGVFPEKNWFLREHRLFGVPTFPSTAYLELAQSAFATIAQGQTIEIRDVFFFAPFGMALGEEKELELILKKDGGEYTFTIHSRDRERIGWREHCNGRLAVVPNAVSKQHDIEALRNRVRKRFSPTTRVF